VHLGLLFDIDTLHVLYMFVSYLFACNVAYFGDLREVEDSFSSYNPGLGEDSFSSYNPGLGKTLLVLIIPGWGRGSYSLTSKISM